MGEKVLHLPISVKGRDLPVTDFTCRCDRGQEHREEGGPQRIRNAKAVVCPSLFSWARGIEWGKSHLLLKKGSKVSSHSPHNTSCISFSELLYFLLGELLI